MTDASSLPDIAGIVKNTSSSLVVIGDPQNADQVAAALSLKTILQETVDIVTVVAPEPARFELLPQVKEIETKLGNEKLNIIFEYLPEKIDKVDYVIDEENKKFILVVQPQAGTSPLNAEQVSYEYTGVQAETIFLVGVQSWDGLGSIYSENKDVFESATTVAINTYASSLADVAVDASDTSSLSEKVHQIAEQFDHQMTDTLATKLLYGIEAATNQFSSYKTTAETFTLVGELMAAGGQRLFRGDTQSSQEKSPEPQPLANVSKKGAVFKPNQEDDAPQLVDSKKKHRSKSKKSDEEIVGSLQHQPGKSGSVSGK